MLLFYHQYKHWRNPNADVEANVLDTIINAASYLYQVIRLSSRRAAGDYMDIAAQEAHIVTHEAHVVSEVLNVNLEKQSKMKHYNPRTRRRL
jgi:hypothetical protein